MAFYRRPLDLVEQVREPFQNPDAPSGTGGMAGQMPTVAARHRRRTLRRHRAGRYAEPATPVRVLSEDGRRRRRGCAKTILTAWRGAPSAAR